MFNKPYSDATAEKIDQEAKKIIESAYERTKKLLVEHRQHLEVIAKELLQKEILFQTDLERLIGKRPFAHQTAYEKFTNSNNGATSGSAKEETKKEPHVAEPKEPVQN